MLRCIVIAACLASAGLCADSGTFEWIDEWTVGDLPTFGQASVGLTRDLPQGVTWHGAPPEGTVTQGALPLPDVDGQARVLALALCAEAPGRLYVAPGLDGTLDAGAYLVGADEDLRPPAFGKPSKPFWLVEVDGRTVAVRPGAFGSTLMVAWRGYLAAHLPFDGADRLVAVIDSDADGLLTADNDALHVDTNGDGELSAGGERYTLRKRFEISGAAFSFPETMTPDTATWQAAPTGAAPVTLVLPGVDMEVKRIALALVRGDGRAIMMEKVGSAADVPAGLYHPGGMSLQLVDEKGHVWDYSFRPYETVELEITPGMPLELPVIDGMVLQIIAQEEASPGASVSIRAEGHSASGLATASCSLGDPSEFSVQKTPRVRIMAPDGALVDEATMDFG